MYDKSVVLLQFNDKMKFKVCIKELYTEKPDPITVVYAVQSGMSHENSRS